MHSRFPKVPVAFATVVLACGLYVSGCGGASSTIASAPTPLPTIASNKIQHVVIIIQENRTVDDLFNSFPGIDTVSTGLTHSGARVPLLPRPLEAPGDACHTHDCTETAYDNGKMDGFDLNRNPKGHLEPYSFVPQSETQPYWALAAKYTISDTMFQSNTGPSFPAHQYLIAGQSGLTDNNPSVVHDNNDKWGCDSPSGTIVTLITGGSIFPCLDYQTLGDELDGAGATWRYYAPSLAEGGGYKWSAYDAVSHIRNGPDWTSRIVSPETQILTDVPAGQLMQVTWVVPQYLNSDHGGSESNTGPQWVASVVNAIGTSPFWNTTAIFIVWDDWGGWYDHVERAQLDQMGLGFRVPLLVISPYARPAYVSHVPHEFGSILKFTEETFGLPSLGQTDVRADNLADCFDFTQSPIPFAQVATKLPPSYFLTQPRSNLPPDND
jgi:phospholipase C